MKTTYKASFLLLLGLSTQVSAYDFFSTPTKPTSTAGRSLESVLGKPVNLTPPSEYERKMDATNQAITEQAQRQAQANLAAARAEEAKEQAAAMQGLQDSNSRLPAAPPATYSPKTPPPPTSIYSDPAGGFGGPPEDNDTNDSNASNSGWGISY